MGHFNVACGISNLAIHEGDEIGFVILGDGRVPDPRMSAETGKSFHLYADDNFRPYLPPVFGKYSGYGEVEDMEESITTAVMEEVFGVPAKKVLEMINCSRDLYDTSSEIFKTYYKGSRRFGKWDVSVEEALLPLGFEKVDEESSDQVEVFIYGDYSVAIRKTETPICHWGIRAKGSDVLLAPEFMVANAGTGLSIFSSVTKLLPGYPKEVQSRVKHLKSLNGMFFLKDVFVKMDTYLKEPDVRFDFGKPIERKWDEFIAVLDAFEKEGHDPEPVYSLLEMPQAIERMTCFQKEYLPVLRKYGQSYEYLNIVSLLDMMTALNRMFAPSFCGEQDGNDLASERLNKVTDGILAERRVRFGYNEDDEN